MKPHKTQGICQNHWLQTSLPILKIQVTFELVMAVVIKIQRGNNVYIDDILLKIPSNHNTYRTVLPAAGKLVGTLKLLFST